MKFDYRNPAADKAYEVKVVTLTRGGLVLDSFDHHSSSFLVGTQSPSDTCSYHSSASRPIISPTSL